jgi:CBS domain-containing protein
MSIPHRLLGTVLSSMLTLPVLAAAPARAIPEADAMRKLAVVPVFVLVNDKGVPVPKVNEKEKLLVVPLYMERARAEAERQKAQQANPTGKVQVLPMPMSIASDRINAINATLKDGLRMVGPVVPSDTDLAAARDLLRKEGLKEEAIREGLGMPVFFTRPFLSVNTPEGPRAVFFVTHGDLQKALAGAPANSKLVPQAADITFALRQITQTKEDRFMVFPPPDYFRLVQEQQSLQQKQGAPGAPPPPR